MNRATATIGLIPNDEQGQGPVPELIVTIRLKLGSGPVSPETERITELIERLASGDPTPVPTSVVVADDDPELVTVFPAARTVMRGSAEVRVTRREFDLLLCFAENPLRVFTRTQLLTKVWCNEYTGQRSVDVHVLRLRAKIGMDIPLVMTLRGVGYRLHRDAKVAVVRDR
jgi:two-component system, OmpR family, response regulator MtrA